MSERRVELVKRELKSTQSDDDIAEVCGANNNERQVDSGEQMKYNDSIEKESSRKDLQLVRDSSESCCSSNEIGDWQLVDMDDHMSNSIYLNNNNNINDYNNSCQDGEVTFIESEVKKTKKYVDIDPLGAHRQHYSPTLVHLYTAIYSLLPLASCLALVTLIVLLFTRFYFISLIYFTYIIYDRNTCNRGGRRVDSIYRSKFWSYLAAYFPIRLRHTNEFKLNPSENYILNYHPHGISAFGAVAAFATNGLNFSELFPGITARFMVHETSFSVPVMKETFALRGDCSVNSQSIDYILSDKTRSGNLLTIVVGGLAEADLSDSEVLRIVVAQRKGFVKKALVHGAHIIPCIAFGENSVFNKVNLEPSSFWHRLESRWYNLFKFKHPIYYGRSLFTSKLKGVMPFKRPITVVMGDPIRVEKNPKPSNQQIDEVHAIYLRELRAMYEANSDFCVEFDKVLEII